MQTKLFFLTRHATPDRNALTAGILTEAKAVKERRRDSLQGATTLSVTLDLRTNRRMHSFLGDETAHFITEGEDRQSRIRSTCCNALSVDEDAPCLDLLLAD